MSWNPREDKELQAAIEDYLVKHKYTLDRNFDYIAGIDYVSVELDGVSVLVVNLPPISDYVVEETEHTSIILAKNDVA